MNAHQKILSALYDLYKNNQENESVIKEVAQIAWVLEQELNFDTFGYFELSELATYGYSDENAKKHYIEVIETSLKF